MDRTGRASGEAFVQFESTEDCEKALKRNMEKIGHRWVGSWFGSCYVAILDTKSKFDTSSQNTKRKTKLIKMGRYHIVL